MSPPEAAGQEFEILADNARLRVIQVSPSAPPGPDILQRVEPYAVFLFTRRYTSQRTQIFGGRPKHLRGGFNRIGFGKQ